jgi:hypothetical protein
MTAPLGREPLPLLLLLEPRDGIVKPPDEPEDDEAPTARPPELLEERPGKPLDEPVLLLAKSEPS